METIELYNIDKLSLILKIKPNTLKKYFKKDGVFPEKTIDNIEVFSLKKILEIARERAKDELKNKKFPSSNYHNSHKSLSFAVKNNLINKPLFCEECKNKSLKSLHAHHDDYLKPLDVRWLCFKCHKNWHKINGYGANR